jgi:hypothetical protein
MARMWRQGEGTTLWQGHPASPEASLCDSCTSRGITGPNGQGSNPFSLGLKFESGDSWREWKACYYT